MRRAVSVVIVVSLIALGGGCSDQAGEPEAVARSTARLDIVEALRADLAAERHAADGGGRAWLDPDAGDDEAVVGRPGRFAVVYEAGPLGVAEGGWVMLQVSPFWGWSTPQVEALELPGYTLVSTGAAGVELAPRTLDQQLLGIEVRGRPLAPGEQVLMVYGAGPAGAAVDRYAEQRSPFFVAVDGDGDGVRSLVDEAPSVVVRPGPAAQVVLWLPATARPGDELEATVAVLDRAGNAGAPWRGKLALEVVTGDLDAPSAVELEVVHRGRRRFAVMAGAEGVVRLRARGPGDLEAESNPMVVDGAAPLVLWADLHGHSAMSDGTGSPADYLDYAREIAALDVVALTDHDHWGMPFLDQSPERWQEITAAVAAAHEPGRFVTVLGYEWTSWVWGHRHVLFFEDGGEILSCVDERYDEPTELWAALAGAEALTITHHTAGGPIATDWSVAPDPRLGPLTEVASVHGSSEAPDAPGPIYSAVPGHFARDALDRGYRLGFVGSGDGHDGHPGLSHLGAVSGGLAGILAVGRTRAAVLEALRARRVYATNGPRIVLEATLGGRPMGASVEPGDHRLSVRAVAPAPIEWIDIVRGSARQERVPGSGERELRLERDVGALRTGEWLYVRVLLAGGGAAWSSPFFVD